MASCRSLEDEVVFHYQRHQNRCQEDLMCSSVVCLVLTHTDDWRVDSLPKSSSSFGMSSLLVSHLGHTGWWDLRDFHIKWLATRPEFSVILSRSPWWQQTHTKLQSCKTRKEWSIIFLLPMPTFQLSPVDVIIFRFGQCWIFVEQVGHKSKVEFGISTDDVGRGDKLPTAEPVGLLQHGLCSLHVVSLLNNTQTMASGHTHRTAVTMGWRCSAKSVKALTLKPAMLMSMRGWSSSVPLGEIWLRRWK